MTRSRGFGRGFGLSEYKREIRIRQETSCDLDLCKAPQGQPCLDTLGWTPRPGKPAYASHYGRYKKWMESAMHESVLSWVISALGAEDVAGKRVLEVGSYNVNGSVREYLESLQPREYLGVDVTEGPGVDRVVNAESLTESIQPGFDIVISTEMLEHVENWAVCLAQLAEMTKAGGLLVLTTRSPGFPYHPYPIDTWRYSVRGMTRLLTDMGLLDVRVIPDPQVPGVFAMARRPPLHQPWTPPWSDRESIATAKDLFDPEFYEVTPTQVS